MIKIINVIGENAEAKANAIANYFQTKCRLSEEEWEVDVTDSLEKALCYDEETCIDALEEIYQATGVNIYIDDLEF